MQIIFKNYSKQNHQGTKTPSLLSVKSCKLNEIKKEKPRNTRNTLNNRGRITFDVVKTQKGGSEFRPFVKY